MVCFACINPEYLMLWFIWNRLRSARTKQHYLAATEKPYRHFWSVWFPLCSHKQLSRSSLFLCHNHHWSHQRKLHSKYTMITLYNYRNTTMTLVWSRIIVLLMLMGRRICGALVQFSCYSAAISIDMNGRVCGALVQFGCYQHKHKWMS